MLKIKCIYNVKLLPKSVWAMTIYPFILFYLDKKAVERKTFKHEMVHVKQIREHGWFSFYISYGLYYLANLVRCKNHARAYKDIPYETMAFNRENLALLPEEKQELGLN